MSQVAIDGLPAATTPLAGTEVTPIVQNGVTRQVAVSAIASTAGNLSYTAESASFSAAANSRYALVTSSSAITVTLPAAVVGYGIELADVSHKADVNHITVTAAGSDTIVYQATSAGSQTVSTPGAVVRLVCYASATWRLLLIASA